MKIFFAALTLIWFVPLSANSQTGMPRELVLDKIDRQTIWNDFSTFGAVKNIRLETFTAKNVGGKWIEDVFQFRSDTDFSRDKRTIE